MQHKSITDPEIHEPKGISTATEGTVYVADGAGSGDWENPPIVGQAAAATGTVPTKQSDGSIQWEPPSDPTSGAYALITSDVVGTETFYIITYQSGTTFSLNGTAKEVIVSQTGVYQISPNKPFDVTVVSPVPPATDPTAYIPINTIVKFESVTANDPVLEASDLPAYDAGVDYQWLIRKVV